MLWHEIVCDSCSMVLDGFAGTKNYNSRLKGMAKLHGWSVKKDGTAMCPECQKKMKTDIIIVKAE